MSNPFPYTLDNKRYQTLNYYLRNRFGKKVCKVPLALATTCPNRDGTSGVGGCTFCSASGGGGAEIVAATPLEEQFRQSLAPLHAKWPTAATIPYFQSYTNTHLPLETLKNATTKALALPQAVGLSIATRPDALPENIVAHLQDLSQKTYLVVELGLQTIHDSTGERINRCHSYQDFLTGYRALEAAGVAVCVHLINGLPFETPEMMLATAKAVAALSPHAVKFHMLHIVENTVLAEDYKKSPFPLLTREEYVEIVARQMEFLPPSTVVERVTGDPVAGELVAPQWTLNKLWVRNAIDKYQAEQNTWQGKKYSQNESHELS